MSHLIVEQGKDVGREVTVPPSGMKFGRSPANDLVLEGERVALFHGRFFFKSDGSLWVTDFGAAEKTTVGGDPVDERPLKVGDLVAVDGTAFRVIGSARDADGAAVPPAAASGEIDLGFKSAKKTRHAQQPKAAAPKTSLVSRLLQVGMILLVLVVLLFVVPQLMKMSVGKPKIAPPKESLALAYERVQADTKNIFRYYLELDEKGDFSIQIDDLKNNRHAKYQKHINDTVLLQLSSAIKDAGFFGVDSDFAGTAPGQYDLYDIAVQRNRRFHHIRVLNRKPPPEIKRTVEAIEDFARSELGISFTWNRSPEELQNLAQESVKLGQARYAERDVRYGNLAASIKEFQEAMLYLETFEPKPPLYRQAEDAMNIAIEEQKKRYDEYLFRAEKAIRLGNWNEAAKNLRILLELVPDRSDERNEDVNAKLLNVESHLK